MAMKELSHGESMAQRIVMYPRAWDREESAKGETSRRLLKKAARELKVMLQPVDSIAQVDKGAGLTAEEAYPLTNVLSLINYNRVLLLQQPGLILDPTPLDLLFTLPMATPLLGLSDPQDEEKNPAILLFEPSRDVYQDVMATLPEGAYLDDEFLQIVPIEKAPEDPDNNVHLLATTSLLEHESLNATEFIEMTSYVHLSDPNIPSPEFDIPRQDVLQAMPKGGEARKAWEAVYSKFRNARMDVCGLDLESIETH